MLQALVNKNLKDELFLHPSRDSTVIKAREKAAKKSQAENTENKKRSKGRPKRGEQRPEPELTRAEKQKTLTLEEMLKRFTNAVR